MAAPFFAAYLAGAARALELLPSSAYHPAARIDGARRAARRRVAPEMVAELDAQERALAPSAARRRHFDRLAGGGAAAVVTGQQVGLFLGPLYTFYKAASAIAWARAIERESGVPCVPIFWLQTEDHDFAEIDHCFLPCPGAAPLRVDLAGDGEARRSVAHRRLGDAIAAPLDAAHDALHHLPHAGELMELLRRHYRPDHTVGDAFGATLAALFADEGLLVLDPRREAVARLAAPLYRRALTDGDAIAAALIERGRAVAAAGFDEQVPVRADSSLVFYHRGAADGPRYRLERRDGAWCCPGEASPLSDAALCALTDGDPLRFSTSALLRPVVQDTLLPTVAYVGGPSEVSYFAQLPSLYARFGVAPPLVALRARLYAVDGNSRAILAQLGLGTADLERGRDAVIAAALTAGAGSAAAPIRSPEQWRELLLSEFTRRLDELEAAAPSLDANLLHAVRRTRGTVDRAVARLTGRYARSLVERDGVAKARWERLRWALFPDHHPQERFYSLPYYAAKYGIASFKQRVFAAIDPYDPSIKDFDL